MPVLALLKRATDISTVVPWARRIAQARNTSLTIVCWQPAPAFQTKETSLNPGHAEAADMESQVQECLQELRKDEESDDSEIGIVVQQIVHSDVVAATLEQISECNANFLITAADDPSGRTGATYASNPLLRQSPCNTIILFGGPSRSRRGRFVIVGTTDSAHDYSAVSLVGQLTERCNMRATIARLEVESGDLSNEIGLRDIRQLMRDVGIRKSDRIKRRVFTDDRYRDLRESAERYDLVLLSANGASLVRLLTAATKTPTIGVIKRAPPLRAWRRGRKWKPRLSPADYADLVSSLRRSSRLSVDFVVMLGLAAAIASLGLLQDSAAVVIGSMLLAPLMTPMITAGLALSQANMRLGRASLGTIIVGFVLTLVVSFCVGLITPGEQLTQQILARGEPNILDLLIALFSGTAAAYALARPSLVGAVAGVAIATALVPPLCSVGIALTYRELLTAEGAALLFLTNFVAIVLGASVTFRMLGVTAARIERSQRRWVARMIFAFTTAIIVLTFPLQRSLVRNIDRGKPQPNTYPLTMAVEDALSDFIQKTPNVDIIGTGRPSSPHDRADVVVFLSTPGDIVETYADQIADIVRKEMNDESLIVEVHCLRAVWRRSILSHGSAPNPKLEESRDDK